MNFKDLLLRAKAGDQASLDHMVRLYDPLLHRMAWHDGAFDEDLYQEMQIILLKCIHTFPV